MSAQYYTSISYLVLGVGAGLLVSLVVLPVRSAHEGGGAVVVDENLVLAAAGLTGEVVLVRVERGLRGVRVGALAQHEAAVAGALERYIIRSFFLMGVYWTLVTCPSSWTQNHCCVFRLKPTM